MVEGTLVEVDRNYAVSCERATIISDMPGRFSSTKDLMYGARGLIVGETARFGIHNFFHVLIGYRTFAVHMGGLKPLK